MIRITIWELKPDRLAFRTECQRETATGLLGRAVSRELLLDVARKIDAETPVTETRIRIDQIIEALRDAEQQN